MTGQLRRNRVIDGLPCAALDHVRAGIVHQKLLTVRERPNQDQRSRLCIGFYQRFEYALLHSTRSTRTSI